MRADVRRRPSDELIFLFYLGAHVLACGLGYFLGNYLFAGRLGLLPLILLYVVLFFAVGFVVVVVEYVFKRLRIILNEFLFVFLSYLVLFASFLFLYFLFSGRDFGKLFNLSTYVLIYFILPLGVSLFAMNLIGKSMGYSFSLDDEQKTMVQGSQSEAVSSTNHREVKAERPIVWNFADYGKRWVVGQDHAIDTIQKVLIANSKLADLGNP
ncbi:MAG: hypothetical protein ACO2PP_17295, partial [Thermocrinis sp.]